MLHVTFSRTGFPSRCDGVGAEGCRRTVSRQAHHNDRKDELRNAQWQDQVELERHLGRLGEG